MLLSIFFKDKFKGYLHRNYQNMMMTFFIKPKMTLYEKCFYQFRVGTASGIYSSRTAFLFAQYLFPYEVNIQLSTVVQSHNCTVCTVCIVIYKLLTLITKYTLCEGRRGFEILIFLFFAKFCNGQRTSGRRCHVWGLRLRTAQKCFFFKVVFQI